MTVQITFNIDETTKQKFEKVCENMGLSPSNVINMLMKNALANKEMFFVAEPPPEKNESH
jgi:addiction module RelB/DinJ family antitoxin